MLRITFLFIMISLSACQTITGPSAELQTEIDFYLQNKDKNFTDSYKSLFIEGERNAVLNFNRLGWLNLVYGDFDEASWAFDQSLNRIEMIYADNKEAEQAKSYFSKEDVKDFKGEPYERAMAYYYRGVLFLIEGDYENARATFKMGEFQDTLSEKEAFQSDFALMNFLQGWASSCNGDTGLSDEAITYAAEYNPRLLYPNEEHNLLLLFETGNSPLKIAVGEHKEILQFQQGADDLAINPDFFLQYNKEQAAPVISELNLLGSSTEQILSTTLEDNVEGNENYIHSVSVDVAKLVSAIQAGDGSVETASGEFKDIMQLLQDAVNPALSTTLDESVERNGHQTNSEPMDLAKLLLALQAGSGSAENATEEYKEILQFLQKFANPALSTALKNSIENEESNAHSVSIDLADIGIFDDQTKPDYLAEIQLGELDQENSFLEKTVGSVSAAQAANVFFQANTRGGRPVQGILDGKAQFKGITKTVATVATTAAVLTSVGGALSGNSVVGLVGVGLQIGGVVASMISSATTAEADIRYWDTLPNLVYLATARKPSSDYLVKVGNKGSTIVNTNLFGNIRGGDKDGYCSVFWATSKNPKTIAASSPKARLSWEEMSEKDDDIELRDKQFRNVLVGH